VTKNRSIDLVNMLFEQMENLRDAAPEEIDAELKRARAMSDVAQQINGTYANSIRAAQVRGEYDVATPLLRGGES
jgi:Rod binding domain-containing protein